VRPLLAFKAQQRPLPARGPGHPPQSLDPAMTNPCFPPTRTQGINHAISRTTDCQEIRRRPGRRRRARHRRPAGRVARASLRPADPGNRRDQPARLQARAARRRRQPEEPEQPGVHLHSVPALARATARRRLLPRLLQQRGQDLDPGRLAARQPSAVRRVQPRRRLPRHLLHPQQPGQRRPRDRPDQPRGGLQVDRRRPHLDRAGDHPAAAQRRAHAPRGRRHRQGLRRRRRQVGVSQRGVGQLRPRPDVEHPAGHTRADAVRRGGAGNHPLRLPRP
jgi:hypothetical protein